MDVKMDIHDKRPEAIKFKVRMLLFIFANGTLLINYNK